MKSILSFFIIALPHVLFAQDPPSTYDKDGKVKSVEQRKLDESKNKQNTIITSTSVGSNTGTSAAYRKEVRKVTKDLKDVKAAGKKQLKSYDYVGPNIPQDRSKMDVVYKLVSKDNKWGMVSIMGGDLVTVVVQLFYDEIKYSDNLRLGVRVGNKWGFIDGGAFGMSLYPDTYDDLLSEYSVFSTTVVKNGKKCKINYKGEIIDEVKTDILAEMIETKTIPLFEKFTDLTDERDKKTYSTIKVKQQICMAQNLSVQFFRNGDAIPLVNTDKEWKKAGKQHLPACCYYGYDSENGKKYGLLYNWYAVSDARGLAPQGWHIASNDEWRIFGESIGSYQNAGERMKTTTGWVEGNGNNASGFAGLPGGELDVSDERSFYNIGRSGTWWTSSSVDADKAMYMSLSSFFESLAHNNEFKHVGFSVRCIMN